MKRRLLVNDALSQLGERTFWHLLQEWFKCEFVGGPYETLADTAYRHAVYKVADEPVSIIIRNATWFPPIQTDVPTIALLQDVCTGGPQREMQNSVLAGLTHCHGVAVYNSELTRSHYGGLCKSVTIPLPVDFSLFELQNAMGCQQMLSLPDGCICWIGASQGAAGHVKGFDIFMQIVRQNPDLRFVAVFKDAVPGSFPPNLRCFARLPQPHLVNVINACRVGLCTSRTESQHLAGIEMGACGLPLVVPPVGCYWQRKDWPGVEVLEPTVAAFTTGIRSSIGKMQHMGHLVRDYWSKEFDIPVVRAAWESLVGEVECSGQS